MEFWGVEVKSGQPLEVDLEDGKVLHLSQACLGEIKSNKTNESVCLYINIDNRKLVLGTLNSERLPQQLFDLVIDKECELYHNWKNGSVYFYGYKVNHDDGPTDSEESDSDDGEDLPLPTANGKSEVIKEDNPEDKKEAKKKDGKQKVKIVEPEPEKVKKADEDDSDSDDSDSMSEDDSDEDDKDSSDSEEGSDDEEETPKKQQSGKKRQNESVLKTPSDKKAKMATPQKTDGKKAGGHVATPHPSKPNKQVKLDNKSNQKSPASTSTDGQHSCKPCSRTFKSDSALQAHNQAKHK